MLTIAKPFRGPGRENIPGHSGSKTEISVRGHVAASDHRKPLVINLQKEPGFLKGINMTGQRSNVFGQGLPDPDIMCVPFPAKDISYPGPAIKYIAVAVADRETYELKAVCLASFVYRVIGFKKETAQAIDPVKPAFDGIAYFYSVVMVMINRNKML